MTLEMRLNAFQGLDCEWRVFLPQNRGAVIRYIDASIIGGVFPNGTCRKTYSHLAIETVNGRKLI